MCCPGIRLKILRKTKIVHRQGKEWLDWGNQSDDTFTGHLSLAHCNNNNITGKEHVNWLTAELNQPVITSKNNKRTAFVLLKRIRIRWNTLRDDVAPQRGTWNSLDADPRRSNYGLGLLSLFRNSHSLYFPHLPSDLVFMLSSSSSTEGLQPYSCLFYIRVYLLVCSLH